MLVFSDWFMCSVVTVACILPYGSVDWFKKGHGTSTSTSRINEVVKWSAQSSVVCHTKHAFANSKRKALIFTANVHNYSVVSVSLDSHVNKYLINSLSNFPCGFLIGEENSYCCAYSQELLDTNSNNFTFFKTLRTDPYFHIEDIYYGKPRHVDQTVIFTHRISQSEEKSVTVKHTCRSDVTLDPYPEIHMTVKTKFWSGESKTSDFHWYL